MTTTMASTSNSNSNKRCYLLEIPPELRVRIYDFVWDSEHKYDVTIYSNRKACLTNGPSYDKIPAMIPHLLFTCRTINIEATPVFYGKIRIEVFAVPYTPYYLNTALNRPLKSLGSCGLFRHMQKCSRVNLELPQPDTWDIVEVSDMVEVVTVLLAGLREADQDRLRVEHLHVTLDVYVSISEAEEILFTLDQIKWAGQVEVYCSDRYESGFVLEEVGQSNQVLWRFLKSFRTEKLQRHSTAIQEEERSDG